MAPAGTPKPIVDKLNAEIRKILQKPDFRIIGQAGAEPMIMTADEFETYIRADIVKWADVIKTSG